MNETGTNKVLNKDFSVLHVNTTDTGGGAARAAVRLHQAFIASGIDSRMRVLYGACDDERIIGGSCKNTYFQRKKNKLLRRYNSYLLKGWHTDNPNYHTFNGIGANLVSELNSFNAKILNLHWISGMLSVKEISQINKPIVWTLHDMWAFCGGEHYAPDNLDSRFRLGYFKNNRPSDEQGRDLNRLMWENKVMLWKNQKFTFVCPSHWMAKCTRDSVLFSSATINVIPNVLDTDTLWHPIPKEVSRLALGLPLNKKLILFGANGGLSSHNKGGDLILKVLERVAKKYIDAELIIYGQKQRTDLIDLSFKIHWLGPINDDRILALAYSAADVMVVPSRQEAFGQTASEAHACGTPVVAFNIGGLPDIVTHLETGFLAKPYDTDELSEGILWVLQNHDRLIILSKSAREKALRLFSPRIVSEQYANVYAQVLNELG